jgi:hypothetical protein
MAHHVNTQFKDGSRSRPLADVVAAPPPRFGDMISVNQQGRNVSVRVTAVWMPSVKFQGRAANELITVEAREL